jgi:hypothetical protein
MDYRSFEWLQLLPPGTDFVVERAPATFCELLPAPIDPSARGYVGWGLSRPELPDLTGFEAVALIRPRSPMTSALAYAGFSTILSLTAIPSIDRTHWLLPLAGRRVEAASVSGLVTPWRYHDRLKKDVLLWMARVGRLRLVGDTVVLGRRSRSALEIELERVLDVSPIVLAMKTGPLGIMRKVTLQIMTPGGDVIGYAKLATSPDARAVVQREVECLKDLSTYPELRDVVPRLVGSFEIPSGLVGVLAPGPSRRGPAQFGGPHREFLRTMAAATGRHLRFADSEMWKDMQAKRRALESVLVEPWRQRITTTLHDVEASLGSREFLLGTAHRDFGPWNTRLREDGRLFVFDWDNARREMIPLYDLFTFQFLNYGDMARHKSDIAVVADIVAAGRRWWPELDRDTILHLFLAYLTEVALSSLGRAIRVARMDTEVLKSVGALLDRRHAWLPSPAQVSA